MIDSKCHISQLISVPNGTLFIINPYVLKVHYQVKGKIKIIMFLSITLYQVEFTVYTYCHR